MKSRGELIISSLIIAVALIICTTKLTNTNAFRGILNAYGSINSSVSLNNGQANQRSYNEVLSIYDATSYLGIDEATLRNVVNSGNVLGIPYVSTGGQIIFSKKALDEWIYNASKSSINSKP